MRDAVLQGLSNETVSEPHPAKGEHDRMGEGGFDVLPADDRAVTALRGAISDLRPAARSELFALMCENAPNPDPCAPHTNRLR